MKPVDKHLTGRVNVARFAAVEIIISIGQKAGHGFSLRRNYSLRRQLLCRDGVKSARKLENGFGARSNQ